MSTWPLRLVLAGGTLTLEGPGRFALAIEDDEPVIDRAIDEMLAVARKRLGRDAVGWMPEDGGLLSNLPAWENLLLATQWHVPASLGALEKRLAGWCARLGYDTDASIALLARAPATLDIDERRMIGWLRQLLSRPRLIVLRARAFPSTFETTALREMLAEELAGSALLVVDDYVPAGFESVIPRQTGDATR